MENNPRIEVLFNKYSAGLASQQELEELLYYVQSADPADQMRQLIEQDMVHRFNEVHSDPDTLQRLSTTHQVLLDHIRKSGRADKPAVIKLWPYIAAVAGFLLIIGTIFYANRQYLEPASKDVQLADVLPGSNKAILTLSNGKKVILSGTSSGELADEQGTVIYKNANGEVVYNKKESKASTDALYNTIETSKGGQYQVRLPDGSKVWLNAASKLTYPVSLTEPGKRIVELSGEAYFEVAKDKARPFIVKSSGQQVEVLGTHFNVSSYADEGRTVTTLEEGSVKVSAAGGIKLLRPGQQTVLSGGRGLDLLKADMEQALAWRKNEIVFKDADIREVMRQISRWYDLDIEYRGKVPDDRINGTIDRTANLETVLKMFATIQVHFKLESTTKGKKLVIEP